MNVMPIVVLVPRHVAQNITCAVHVTFESTKSLLLHTMLHVGPR